MNIIPFGHPMFHQTSDGKGEAYIHERKGGDNLIDPPFEILSERAIKHYEKRKEKGESIYIDTLTYEEFMLIDKAEFGSKLISLDEKGKRAKMNGNQKNELEFVDDTQK